MNEDDARQSWHTGTLTITDPGRQTDFKAGKVAFHLEACYFFIDEVTVLKYRKIKSRGTQDAQFLNKLM